jgi:hypothetical protein
MKAKFDMPKLERSLKRLAKDLGDTNAQAIARWGVQTCRELAGSTQAFGKTTASKKKQWNSIEAGARTILNIVPSLGKKKVRVLRTVSEASAYIDSKRTRRGRTRPVPIHHRPFITEKLFADTLKSRRLQAGIAKGGWLGAGQDIATAQKGADRINIGKNFLGYAQKHSAFGKSTHPVAGWSPSAKLTNKASHVASNHVLKSSHIESAVQWGLRKTLTWYRSALRRQNQKQKS